MKPRLHHIDWGGTGTPILFLHGGSAHAHWWDFVAPRFTSAFRVFALDLRGHGESEWVSDGSYRLEDYAGDVAGWIEERKLERPILVGHSLGSFVAMRHAIDHPSDLTAVVVVDGRATFGESGSRYMRLLRLLAPGEYDTLEEAVESFRPLPKETVATPEVLEHVARRSFRQLPSGKWIAKFDRDSLGAHAPFDFRARLGDLECPVLFVRGGESAVLSADWAQRLAASCRHGAWAEVAGAHHHVLLDRPGPLATEIRRFLSRAG